MNEVGCAVGGSARGLHVVETEPFTQRVLFNWDDRIARPASILRDVILSQKEHPSFEMSRLWANEFTLRARLDGALSTKRNWILVPPPGRSGYGESDHAGALVEALAAANRGHLVAEVETFERVGESRRAKLKSQKLKTREERSTIEFRLSDFAKSRVRRAPGFIFVDDVIATGATAKAAWIALGKPRAFESWAIAFKVRELPIRTESDPGSVRELSQI
ncbi:hypothetical protein BH10BDE1_BH10BDE1_30220 [soil metagenome]